MATVASSRSRAREAFRDLPTLTQRPVPRVRVLAGFFCAVLVLTAIALWPQLAHPALYRDDWQLAWSRLYHAHNFLGWAVGDAFRLNRPVYVLVNHVLTAIFGHDARALLLTGLVLDALVCVAAFALLSVLGMGVRAAGALAALLMVFPLADSTRLMLAMATSTLGAGLYLVGATLAIRALAKPPRQSRRLHVAAIGFYLLSLLTYESAAALIVFSFLVYRLVVPWRVAIRHWLVEIGALAVLFGTFLILNRTLGHHTVTALSIGHIPNRLAVFGYESVGALALTLFPAGPALVTKLVVLERVGALLALVLLLIACTRARRGDPDKPLTEAGRWAGTVVVAVVALALAYLPFVIAQGAYHPLARGEGNRVNQLAAIPLLVIGYGVLRIAWALVPTRMKSSANGASRHLYAAIPAVALLVASVVTVRGDIKRWQYTATRQRQLQQVVTAALAHRPGPFTIVVVGPLDLFSPGIPHPAYHEVIGLQGTFSVPLGRVLELEYLVPPGMRFTCGKTKMFPAGSPGWPSFYGTTLLLHWPAARPIFIVDQQMCVQQTTGA